MPGKDASRPLSTGRKWLFGLVGFVLLPLLVLAAMEMGFRIAGFGYPTAFFKRLRIGQTDCLVENDKFGLRFFPPELARSPPPVVMKAKKGARTYRVFILGESAALGDPRPAYGAGRYLQALLEERFPDFNFEVVCGAVTAINSHGVLPIARECARHEGDLWIVYLGNNEMVGPFGAATIFGAQCPPLWQVRLSLAAQQTRVGQLVMGLLRKVTGAGKHGPAWGGMRMFLENRIAPHDPRKEAVYRSFRRNLEDILRAGRSHGVPVILNTMAVNLKDCPPFGSLHDVRLPEADRQAHARLRAAAAEAANRGDLGEAVRNIEQAARLDANYAELQFQWGEYLRSRGEAGPAQDGNFAGDQIRLTSEAAVHYKLARDYDALPFRADSRINTIIREAAREVAGSRLVLCDAVSLFATNSPTRMPGKEVFYEHVHFNNDGNYLLARAWAVRAEPFLPAAATNQAAAGWASQERCEQRLALTDWNRYAILEDVAQRLAQPPFVGQLHHTQAIAKVRAQMRTLRQRMDRPAADQARQVYLAALKLAPEDHRLHENFAQFLEGLGELSAAAAEWQRVRQLIPHHHVAYFQTGRLLARQGEIEAGRELLSRAVKLRPDLAEGWLELGKLDDVQREARLALEDYERARRLVPNDCRVHYHLGKTLARLDRRTEAIQCWRRSLELRPDYWEAHYALGEELAFAGRDQEARREFETVLRLKPDYAMAHLNLGVALARRGDIEDARRHLEDAARLAPENPQARDYLQRLRARQ